MKVYTRTYNENHAFFAKAFPPLVVPAGTKKCFMIPFPSEGFLERLVIWQDNAAGPQGPQGPQSAGSYDFEIELLNSSLPFPPGEYDPDEDGADDLVAYRIPNPPTAPLSQVAGQTLSLVDDDFGIGFRNIDGGWTLNQRALYLIIKPIDAFEDTAWNVTLQCRTDVG